MSSITLLGDTSGSVVIDAPAIAGSNTITLPTTGGTIRTTTTPGTVLQFVSASSTTFFSSNSTANISTGISISITPTRTSSKILVAFVGGDVDTQAGGRQVYLMIYRNGTNLGVGGNAANGDYYFESSRGIAPINIVVVDSPNTTSSVTYTLYARCGQGTFQINSQSIGNYIYAMEIAV